MPTVIALAARYWYLAVIGGLMAFAGFQRIELDRAHADVASYKAAIALNNQKARDDLDAEVKATDTVRLQYEQAKAANDQLSADIYDRVLDYENRLAAATAAAAARRINGAPGVAARPATADATAAAQPEPGASADPTPEIIASTLAACYGDDQRFVALQDWVRALTAPAPR